MGPFQHSFVRCPNYQARTYKGVKRWRQILYVQVACGTSVGGVSSVRKSPEARMYVRPRTISKFCGLSCHNVAEVAAKKDDVCENIYWRDVTS